MALGFYSISFLDFILQPKAKMQPCDEDKAVGDATAGRETGVSIVVSASVNKKSKDNF